MNNTAIKVQNVSKIYKLYDKPIDRLKESLSLSKKQYHKEFYALNDVSFEIKKGETVGIIGKNGAGKSTLLKIITGVLTPTSGHVHVNGRIASLLELGAGFNPEYTGIENIYLQGTLMGYGREEMEAKVDSIVAFADIGDFVHQPVKMYSSGMFARLAFAVAINVDPDILIVDEALSVGDAAFQRKCFARMEAIRSNGATILFVSHAERQIVELCDRAIMIHSGACVIDGKPKIVTSLYSKMINSNSFNMLAVKEEFESKMTNLDDEASADKADAIEIGVRQDDDDFEEYFDESLIPQSTIEYESKGARISDVEITTLDGRKVNVLRQSQGYHIKCDIHISKTNEYVFGGYISTVNGIVLSGAVYPELIINGNFICLPSNSSYKLKFYFDVHFNSGDYFLSIIIRDRFGDIVHQLKDMLHFKITSSLKTANAYTNALKPMGLINHKDC